MIFFAACTLPVVLQSDVFVVSSSDPTSRHGLPVLSLEKSHLEISLFSNHTEENKKVIINGVFL